MKQINFYLWREKRFPWKLFFPFMVWVEFLSGFYTKCCIETWGRYLSRNCMFLFQVRQCFKRSSKGPSNTAWTWFSPFWPTFLQIERLIEVTWTYHENILWHEVSVTLKLALHHKRLVGPLFYLGYIISVNNFIRHVCH